MLPSPTPSSEIIIYQRRNRPHDSNTNLDHATITRLHYFVFKMNEASATATISLSEHLSLPLIFSGVRVAQSEAFEVVFCRSLSCWLCAKDIAVNKT